MNKNSPEVYSYVKENINEFSIQDINDDKLETKAFSNHSANLIEEWKDSSEDDIWK